jgi:hypothetical protein
MTKDSDPATKKDDLNAVKVIREALEGFTAQDQERILRWARESAGLKAAPPAALGVPSAPLPQGTQPANGQGVKDIKTFVDEKAPRNDLQLVATIAYYYRFEAPEAERRTEMDAKFLEDACRRAGRPGSLTKPNATLHNAQARGLLDKGSKRGAFAINSVGENLVGMILPGDGEQGRAPRGKKKKAKKKRGA